MLLEIYIPKQFHSKFTQDLGSKQICKLFTKQKERKVTYTCTSFEVLRNFAQMHY